jgi:hypothetical protein
VIIDYPCNKHAGAPMTFILNLHGTTPVAQHFYQEGYFSAYKYVGSHNLIIATPSSVVEQWGNGDNGEDLPYLMDVIDWVYKTLGSQFDIRSMWVGGEMDIGPPLDQGTLPMQHGCGQSTMVTLGNNTQTLWPKCSPGFVHSNYLMLGKMHIDFMDDVVVMSIVDLINQSRP